MVGNWKKVGGRFVRDTSKPSTTTRTGTQNGATFKQTTTGPTTTGVKVTDFSSGGSVTTTTVGGVVTARRSSGGGSSAANAAMIQATKAAEASKVSQAVRAAAERGAMERAEQQRINLERQRQQQIVQQQTQQSQFQSVIQRQTQQIVPQQFNKDRSGVVIRDGGLRTVSVADEQKRTRDSTKKKTTKEKVNNFLEKTEDFTNKVGEFFLRPTAVISRELTKKIESTKKGKEIADKLEESANKPMPVSIPMYPGFPNLNINLKPKTVIEPVGKLSDDAIMFASFAPFLSSTKTFSDRVIAEQLRQTLKNPSFTTGFRRTTRTGTQDITAKTVKDSGAFKIRTTTNFKVQDIGKDTGIIKSGKGITRVIYKPTGKEFLPSQEFTFTGKTAAGTASRQKQITILNPKIPIKYKVPIEQEGGVGQIDILTKDLTKLKGRFGGIGQKFSEFDVSISGPIKKISGPSFANVKNAKVKIDFPARNVKVGKFSDLTIIKDITSSSVGGVEIIGASRTTGFGGTQLATTQVQKFAPSFSAEAFRQTTKLIAPAVKQSTVFAAPTITATVSQSPKIASPKLVVKETRANRQVASAVQADSFSIQDTNTRTMPRTLSGSRTITDTLPKQDNVQDSIKIPDVVQDSLKDEASKKKSVLSTINKFSRPRDRIISIPINIPEEPKKTDMLTGFKIPRIPSYGSPKTGRFNVQVRRFGSFQNIGSFKSLNAALGRGKDVTSRTLAATFKVTGATKLPKSIKGFKTKKTKTGTEFIELPKLRLSKRGETEEIKTFGKKKKRSKKKR